MKLTKPQINALVIVENAASEWLYLVESKRAELQQSTDYDPREADWLREQINIVGSITRALQENEECLL